jgi:LysR family glycine cleavage system transcriptional activator
MKRLPPLNALRAFQVTAQLGSFTKAGDVLNVTQGAVSRQVKLLETTLGRPLFLRVHQGIRLTEAGEQLAQGLHLAFNAMQTAVERVYSDRSRQQIAVNTPPTFATRWLAPRLSDFCQRYPLVDLQITTDSVQSLREGTGLDCLVVYEREAWPRSEGQLLTTERHVLVGHPKFWRNEVPPSLTDMTLLHILNGHERLRVWERWIEAHQLDHLDPKPGLTFSTLDQVINAAVSGTGVAVVDEAMVRPELASGALRRINDLHLDGPYGYWLVDVSLDDETRATVRLFQEWLLEQIQQDRPLSA